MKIGILTFHWANNYGAILQAFALYSKLQQIGYTPVIIDRKPEYNGIIRKLYHKISYKHFFSWYRFNNSNKKLFDKTRPYINKEDIKACIDNDKLDAIIVGSDQVWRWLDIAGYNYYLDFVGNKTCRRISYAASFGLSKWEKSEEQTRIVKDLLEKFNAISVREESGVTICKEVFKVNGQLVLDPTMLHDQSFYINSFGLSRKKTNCVVSYILGEDYSNLLSTIKQYATSLNKSHIELCHIKPELPFSISSSCPLVHFTLKEWLNSIYNADIVITNSFHATVFSILFRKNFYVLNNESGGIDRIMTLLSNLGLGDRLVNSIIKGPKDIPNYEGIETKIAGLQKESISFLLYALS